MKIEYPLGRMFRNAPGKSKWLVLILILSAAEAFAQPGLPGDPAQAPLDSGLAWLMLLGLFYAIRKIRNKKGRDNT